MLDVLPDLKAENSGEGPEVPATLNAARGESVAWFSLKQSPVGDFTEMASPTTDPPRTRAFTGVTSGPPDRRPSADGRESIEDCVA